VLSFDGNIAWQPAEPERQAVADEKKAPDGGENQSADDEPLTEFTRWIHLLRTLELDAERSSRATKFERVLFYLGSK